MQKDQQGKKRIAATAPLSGEEPTPRKNLKKSALSDALRHNLQRRKQAARRASDTNA